MKLGVLTFALESCGDPAILAKKAEEVGFYSFWVPEHPVVPVDYSTRYPDIRLFKTEAEEVFPNVALAEDGKSFEF